MNTIDVMLAAQEANYVPKGYMTDLDGNLEKVPKYQPNPNTKRDPTLVTKRGGKMNARYALNYLQQMVFEATCLDEEAFDAIVTLADCVDACEIVACNGQYNQYNLGELKTITRSAYEGSRRLTV